MCVFWNSSPMVSRTPTAHATRNKSPAVVGAYLLKDDQPVQQQLIVGLESRESTRYLSDAVSH